MAAQGKLDNENIQDLIKQFQALGLSQVECTKLHDSLALAFEQTTQERRWQAISQALKAKHYPFEVHRILYEFVYPHWDAMPAAAWFPDAACLETSNIARLMQTLNLQSFDDLYHWSITHYQNFWQRMTETLGIQFIQPYKSIVDLSKGAEEPRWYLGAKLNIASSCFQASNTIALIAQTEMGNMETMTYKELNALSNRIASSLIKYVKKGDRIAIIMPMTIEAVAIYLGVIKAGCCVVSIADSFSPNEIAIRLKISDAKIIFTQDAILRDGKQLPLYKKIIETNPVFVIVLPEDRKVTLRSTDMTWQSFLSPESDFQAVACDPDDFTNILFSSGTTGEPKAIPWTHTTPIKCGTDAHLHQNIKPGDVVCWPTSLGWMMGPWLIYAALLNKATIALFDGAPTGKAFGTFVQDAKVNVLGLVPSLVKAWRHSACMEGLDWRAMKLFSSSGECSNVIDMLYLMWLVDYRPIIEYCGGTEIGGAYLSSTVVQPSAPAAFTTPTLGLNVLIIDEHGKPATKGEVVIIPPSMGLSTTLLNKNHHDVYYAGMPVSKEHVLRRHGDAIVRFANGFYRILGRTDDTMNLGGIKVSSAEIERTLNLHAHVQETAAISHMPSGGGPSELVIYVVLKKKIAIDELKKEMQLAIKKYLNPLFKIHDVVIVDSLPRTASNKIIRRKLRDDYQRVRKQNE